MVIELQADIGGGKTTFTKGLAMGLGCIEDVVSPTFTISREYQCTQEVFLHHFDFYRLADPGIISEIIKEAIDSPGVITVVEWPETIKQILPQNRLTINFEQVTTDPESRRITVHDPGSMTAFIKKLEAQWIN